MIYPEKMTIFKFKLIALSIVIASFWFPYKETKKECITVETTVFHDNIIPSKYNRELTMYEYYEIKKVNFLDEFGKLRRSLDSKSHKPMKSI